MTTPTKLERLADILLDAACQSPAEAGEELSTKEKVEIFKAVAAWYLGVRKAKKGEPDDTDSGETFAALQQRINGKGIMPQ